MSMNLKSLGPSNWVDFIRSSLLLLLLVGGTLGAAGDFRWLKISEHKKLDTQVNQKITMASAEQTKALQQLSQDVTLELALYRINALDTQITFLKIKVQQGEASESEKIILPTLERQLRELKSAIE